MCVLLTTLYLLALGKILCQVQVSQEVRYLPSPFLPGRGNLPRHFHRSTPSLQTYEQLPLTTAKSIPFLNKNNVSVTTQQSAITNQQKRRLFISRVETRRMKPNRPFANPVTTNSTNATSAQNTNYSSTRVQNNSNNLPSAQNNTDVYDKVIFEDDPPMEINSITPEGPARNGSSTGNKNLKTVTETPLPGNVTLEDRASFDGDQCPTGYVRVNGMCVQEE